MKYIFLAFTAFGMFFASAQDQQQNQAEQPVPQDSIPFELRRQAYIYELGKKYNDPIISRMALYNILSTNPNSTPIMDSLALLYLDYQQYASAALIAQDAMRVNPGDLFATEVAAVSFDNLGVKTRAVDLYEKLYQANEDLGTLYRVAFLQYDLKRFNEAKTNADILSESPEAEKLKLVFQKTQNENQQISLKASAMRLKGMVAEAQGNVDQAKEFYQKALELEPEFAVVKQQLEQLNKK